MALRLLALRAAGLVAGAGALLAAPQADPFAFFRPTVVISQSERRALDRREPLVRVLPAASDEIAVLAASAVRVDGDRLVAWIRRIAELKRGPMVSAIGRFSVPPRLDDLNELVLDETEFDRLRRCKPKDCLVKLGAEEIAEVQRAIAGAGTAWKPAVQATLRRLVLQRVQTYGARGRGALADYADHDAPVSPQEMFASLVQASPFLKTGVPRLSDSLARYPAAPASDMESFIYWSNELLSGHRVVQATQVWILRGRDGTVPDALVLGAQIFATHYMNGSLTMTALVRGPAGSPNYLVHLNRSKVDVFGGLLGGLVRMIAERRVKAETAQILQDLVKRLETGTPGTTYLLPSAHVRPAEELHRR